MNIGDKVKIKNCDTRRELVGQLGEIVDLQIQVYEKYRQYSVWAKIMTGEHKGNTYGFREADIQPVPDGTQWEGARKEADVRRMTTKVFEQVEDILRGVVTVDELAEIERAVQEVKGRIMLEPAMGFWEGKTPCWEMFHCPAEIKNECPAFNYRSLACWEVEGTYCKLFDYGARGDGTDICRYCRVYKRWGQGEPVKLKLFGKGFNRASQ